MRSLLSASLMVLLSSSLAGAQECVTCPEAISTAGACGEVVPWCGWSSEPRCPENLEPLFCSGWPEVEEACVFIGAASECGAVSSVWCCDRAGEPLPELGYYCTTAADCAPPPSGCLVAECWPFYGAPDPYGTPGKCAYATALDGTECGAEGCCVAGACVETMSCAD